MAKRKQTKPAIRKVHWLGSRWGACPKNKPGIYQRWEPEAGAWLPPLPTI